MAGVHANEFNDRPTGWSPLVVAVIDTGIDPEAMAASHGAFLPVKDMVSGKSWELAALGDRSEVAKLKPMKCIQGKEETRHGTDIANLIAAIAQDDEQKMDEVVIQPIRAHDGCEIKRKDLLNSLAWAAGLAVPNEPLNHMPARIVNLSITSNRAFCASDLQSMIDKLIERNIFVVTAAGNTFHQSFKEPANCKGVISVGATDAKNRISDYSALDPAIRVYAFGGEGMAGSLSEHNIYRSLAIKNSTQERLGKIEELLWRNKGTSFAASVVTGYLASWLKRHAEKSVWEFLSNFNQLTYSINVPQDCKECSPRALLPVAFSYVNDVSSR